MQYGDLDLNAKKLVSYVGSNPANDNPTYVDYNSLPPLPEAVNQRDADLIHFWHKVHFIYKFFESFMQH